MKILTILGARPQCIKTGSISREIVKYVDIQEVIVYTGQHFDANMFDIFFNEMQIPEPKYNLNINDLGHGAMTGQMLEKIEEILLKEVELMGENGKKAVMNRYNWGIAEKKLFEIYERLT